MPHAPTVRAGGRSLPPSAHALNREACHGRGPSREKLGSPSLHVALLKTSRHHRPMTLSGRSGLSKGEEETRQDVSPAEVLRIATWP